MAVDLKASVRDEIDRPFYNVPRLDRNLNMVLSRQFLSQLDPQLRDAILGNAGTIISFRVGSTDAKILENEFHPEISITDPVNLPNYNIYLKLMVDERCPVCSARRR
jgi:hypothetical protein